MNRWNYTQSNPVNAIDPSGHKTVYVTIGSIAGVKRGGIPQEEPQDLQSINDASRHNFTPITNRADAFSAAIGLCVSVLDAFFPSPPSPPNIFIGLNYHEDDSNGSIDNFHVRISNHSSENVYLREVKFVSEDLPLFCNICRSATTINVRSPSGNLLTVKPNHLEEASVPDELKYGSEPGRAYLRSEKITITADVQSTVLGLGFTHLTFSHTINFR